MSKISFLAPQRPDFEQIRHQIRGIQDSYSHEWDLLSELSQNAVDAIAAVEEKEGRIDLLVDASNRKISIRDNGAGIDPADMAKLLRPFGTNKLGRANQLGQKGVGLKFVIFTSSHFEVQTNTTTNSCIAKIEGAAAWSRATDERMLELDLTERELTGSRGTTVEVTIDNPEHPIFNYTFQDLVFLLRSKTALGNANYIWDKPLRAKFTLIHIDKGGVTKADTYDCKYLLPTESLAPAALENLDDFLDWLKNGDRSDQEKRRRLVGKVIFAKGVRNHAGRDIRYWSCFVPGRDTWTQLSAKFGVASAGTQSDGSDSLPGVGFEGGFQTVTKGMPTGISIELRPRGQAGYLPNFFILIDDPSLSFDIGRKSVHGRQQGPLRDIAYEAFNRFLSDIQKYLGAGADVFESMGNREETFEEISNLPDLDSPKTAFKKRPNDQEATVVAMFFEQIGRGELEDVTPLISGYKRRYDLYARWKRKQVVIEFKFNLQGLFKDFSDERKMFNDINVVVLWEITEQDRVEAKRHGISLEPLQPGSVSRSNAFPGSTYLLTMGPNAVVFVVEMKDVIDAG